MFLTRDELCNLAARIEGALTRFEPGAAVRLKALTSLDDIRRVMVSPSPALLDALHSIPIAVVPSENG